VFLVDGAGYLTSLSRLGLSGQLDYIDRNYIEKWFHTLRCGSTASIRRGWAVDRASASGLRRSSITIISSDRTKHSMNARQPRRKIRQCRWDGYQGWTRNTRPTNTEGGQFYPRLNELVERGFLTKSDHPEDARGFTCDLTEEGRRILAQLFVRNATSLDIDVPETELPASPPTRHLRGRSRG